MPPPLTVHAIERGRAPALLPRQLRLRSIAYYDIVVPPAAPLSIGQRVKVNTLTVIEDPVGDATEIGSQRWYRSSPADVEGEIIGIRTVELAVTEFILRNEVNQSLVEHAYLAIQHIEGVTVRLGLWRRIVRTLALPVLAHTRHVPLERRAVVIEMNA